MLGIGAPIGCPDPQCLLPLTTASDYGGVRDLLLVFLFAMRDDIA